MAAQEQSLLNVQNNLANVIKNIESNLFKRIQKLENNVLTNITTSTSEAIELSRNDYGVVTRLPTVDGFDYSVVSGFLNPFVHNGVEYISVFGPSGKRLVVGTTGATYLLWNLNDTVWPFEVPANHTVATYGQVKVDDELYISGVVASGLSGKFSFLIRIPVSDFLAGLMNFELIEKYNVEGFHDYRMYHIGEYLYRIGNNGYIPALGAKRRRYSLLTGTTEDLDDMPPGVYTTFAYNPDGNQWLVGKISNTLHLISLDGMEISDALVYDLGEHPSVDVTGYVSIGNGYFINTGFVGSIHVFKLTDNSFVLDDESSHISKTIRDFALNAAATYGPSTYESSHIFAGLDLSNTVWPGPNGDWTGFPVLAHYVLNGISHWLFADGMHVRVDISAIPSANPEYNYK